MSLEELTYQALGGAIFGGTAAGLYTVFRRGDDSDGGEGGEGGEGGGGGRDAFSGWVLKKADKPDEPTVKAKPQQEKKPDEGTRPAW